jgi:hypothetical protein
VFLDLDGAQWRKSTYSGPEGGMCVEVTFVAADPAWRKSSHSGGEGGDCVEVSLTTKRAAVRDSKNTTGAVLAFPPTTWSHFTNTAP